MVDVGFHLSQSMSWMLPLDVCAPAVAASSVERSGNDFI